MKISVKICSGTACYVMGGSELLSISEHLTTEELELVDIKGHACFGLCNEYNPETPFAKVNEVIVPNANIESLTKVIRQAIRDEINNEYNKQNK